MREFICILKANLNTIIGVGGTLLGTILGWALNSLSHKGRLHLYVSKWKDSFQYNDMGSMVPSTSIAQTEMYTYSFSLDIYNSSGIPKIMRELKVVFMGDKESIYSEVPEDDSTRWNNGPLIRYSEVEPLNIPAKSVHTMSLHGGKWKKNGHELFIWNAKSVYLEYLDDKNKVKRVLLHQENYKNYFENHKPEGENNEQA